MFGMHELNMVVKPAYESIVTQSLYISKIKVKFLGYMMQ